jgi:hypothetical protein
MEILNGTVKKVVGRSTKQALDMGCNSSHYYNRWILRGLILSCVLGTIGCSTLKSSLMTGAATTAAVGVTSVLSQGVIAPAVVGGTTAVVASALTADKSTKGEPIEVQAETFVQEAPDNFFTLLGKLIKMGGIATILIVLVPMVFSWLLPGPIQFKGRKKK